MRLSSGVIRDVPAARVAGGAEDVMLDLAVRQLVKNFQLRRKTMQKPGGEIDGSSLPN